MDFALSQGFNEIIKLHTNFTYYTKEGKVEGASCIDLMIHNIQIIRALDPPALDSGPRLGPWYLRSAKMNGLHTHTHRGMRARSTHTTSSGVECIRIPCLEYCDLQEHLSFFSSGGVLKKGGRREILRHGAR